MTIKRAILILLTIVSLLPVFSSLGASVAEPQIQAKLQLYQTNLILDASELARGDVGENWQALLVGSNPYDTAEKQYQEALKVAENSLSIFDKQLVKLAEIESQVATVERAKAIALQKQELEKQIGDLKLFVDEVNLKMGLIEANNNDIKQAQKIWKNLSQKSNNNTDKTATILNKLWVENQFQDSTESVIKQSLDNWFEYNSLSKLYQLQKREQELEAIRTQELEMAQKALGKLVLIGVIPFLGGFIGFSLFLFLLGQWAIKKDRSLLATSSAIPWETPWNIETVWQVLIVGFFFIGQIVLPFSFGFLGINPSNLTLTLKALYVLLTYFTMAVCGLLILYFFLKEFFPLPKMWFNFHLTFKGLIWGLGGYLVALPLVVAVSLINQELWQGQGGSNPLLFLALQSQNRLALALFFITASIAAPVFEEIMFRGFLLPSLSRYLPLWGAVIISSLVFALAHMSLSEVLPLTILGIVLGFVYMRSQNLLSSMLLHSLWNSGTLLSLFILGSGNQL
jgi:membrane protease YdiL (CAAX protease family)